MNNVAEMVAAGLSLPSDRWARDVAERYSVAEAAAGPLHLYPSTPNAHRGSEGGGKTFRREIIVPCGGWLRESCLHDSGRWIPLRCHKWKCSQCALGKKAEFYQRLEAAWHDSIWRGWTLKFVTLTWATGVDKRRVRLDLQHLVQWIRRTFGYCEYVRIPEFTKRGRLHLHLAMVVDYIPQRTLSLAWKRYAKAPVVDIRAVDDLGRMHGELVKYLTKGPAGKVTYSRHFPKLPEQVQVKSGPCEACGGAEHTFRFCNEDMAVKFYPGEEHARMLSGDPVFKGPGLCGCWGSGPGHGDGYAP